MTYKKLLEIASLNYSQAETALGRMMDIIEEETGQWPKWNDKVPEWILKQFQIKDDQ